MVLLTAQGSGADVFFFWGIPKFSAMTIRKVYDVGWKPAYIVGNPASSVATGGSSKVYPPAASSAVRTAVRRAGAS